jgi:hypothetical protein
VLRHVAGPGALLLLAVPGREVVGGPPVEPRRLFEGLALPGHQALAGPHPHPVLAVQHRLAFVDVEVGLAPGGVHAVDAAPAGAEEAPAGLDGELGGVVLVADVEEEASREEPEDHGFAPAVLLAGDVIELAAPVQPQHRAVGELELGPAVVVGPDAVARKEGGIGHRLLGAALVGPLEADTALGGPYAAVAVGLGGCRPGHRQDQQRGEQRSVCHGIPPIGDWIHGSQACKGHASAPAGIVIVNQRLTSKDGAGSVLPRRRGRYWAMSVMNKVLVRGSKTTLPRGERKLFSSGASSWALA